MMSADDLTEMDRVLRHAVEAQGMMKHMGAKVDRLEAGKAVFSLPRRGEILQQNGFFHGGAVAFLIDVTATTAAATLVDRGKQSCLTAEYKLNFVAPAVGEAIVCEAVVVKHGRKLSVVEARVHAHGEGEPKLVSIALATIAVIDRIPVVT
jgi:uncharacterized protein (TIGR00369 family)